jgi:hypothetical protein
MLSAEIAFQIDRVQSAPVVNCATVNPAEVQTHEHRWYLEYHGSARKRLRVYAIAPSLLDSPCRRADNAAHLAQSRKMCTLTAAIVWLLVSIGGSDLEAQPCLFGDMVMEYKEERGLSDAALIRCLKRGGHPLHPSTLGRYKNGKLPAPMAIIPPLARCLGMNREERDRLLQAAIVDRIVTLNREYRSEVERHDESQRG